MHGWHIILIGYLLTITVTPLMAECRFTSPAHRVALLELYTSEGCSSCPPADRWLSGLDRQGGDGQQFIPLALHVDYWNYIGWQDPFSSPRYTQRQRHIARNNTLGTIYTPQLVLQGSDFRAWRHMNFAALLTDINKQPAQAQIAINLKPVSERVFALQVTASSQQPGSRLIVALYENNLISQVTAGENNGRQLKHDYVVRNLYGPVQSQPGVELQLEEELRLAPDWQLAELGIAAFVEDSRGEILQATAHALACPG